MSGKTAVVAGVANKWSIAWGIAPVLHQAGYQLVLPYLSDREKSGIEKLVSSAGLDNVVIPPDPCNASNDDDIDRLFSFVKESTGRVDAFAHCMAFAPPEALQGDFSATSREAYRIAMDISAYSFVAMTQRASELMTDGGGVVTMTFMASEKVFPHYNVMGSAKAALEHAVRQLAFELGPKNIRVNTISAGPISTVSARGVSGFLDFLDTYKERAPLRRGVTQEEVGKTALYLLSDMASGVTGEVIHVDAGYNVMGI